MALYPPMLAELEDENGKLVLRVQQMAGPGQASIDPYFGADTNDLVKLVLTTGAGTWTEEKPASPNSTTRFSIPEKEFEKGLETGADATLQYTVKKSSGNSEDSLFLNFELKP